jgi:putative glutamine amidotransferase
MQAGSLDRAYPNAAAGRPGEPVTTPPRSRPVFVGIPAALQEPQDELGSGASVVPQSYIQAVQRAGAVPLPIPITDDGEILRALYHLIDGLLLAGGVDIDPSCYGQQPHPNLGKIDPARDRVELTLTRWALRDGLPILGICRGIQTLNVACDGTLWQDLGAQVPTALDHRHQPGQPYHRLTHSVTIAPDSRLADLIKTGEIQVNSLHHQAPRDIGRTLRPVAWAPDGIIEGLEGTGGAWIVGVQWHPEWLLDNPRQLRLVQGFISNCERRHCHSDDHMVDDGT